MILDTEYFQYFKNNKHNTTTVLAEFLNKNLPHHFYPDVFNLENREFRKHIAYVSMAIDCVYKKRKMNKRNTERKRENKNHFEDIFWRISSLSNH